MLSVQFWPSFPTPPLFPYTTLFRSARGGRSGHGLGGAHGRTPPPRCGQRRLPGPGRHGRDRKSTRLNSSHVAISYAVFCLKKKNDLTEANNDHHFALKSTSKADRRY